MSMEQTKKVLPWLDAMQSMDVCKRDCCWRQGPVLVQVAAVYPADEGWRLQSLDDVQNDPLTTPPLKK